jgi:hypothetical protein
MIVEGMVEIEWVGSISLDGGFTVLLGANPDGFLDR